MGTYARERLPDVIGYLDLEGVPLKGPGKWKTGPCHFHGGSDSLRVNVQSGGWVCMACGAKGGDVIAYAMQRHEIGFVEAAQLLGCWADDGKPCTAPTKPATLPARDALSLAAREMRIGFVVMSDMQKGRFLSDEDWHRFIEAARRVEMLAEDAA